MSQMKRSHFGKFRLFVLVFLGSLTGSLGQAVAATPPPAALSPFLASGNFEPGDYSWMQGRFQDASAADKSAWIEIQDWLRKCQEDDQREMQLQMLSAGIVAPQANNGPFDDFVCDQVGISIPHLETDNISVFRSILTGADMVADSIVWTVDAARKISLSDDASLQNKLRARALIDQMLRQAAMAESYGDVSLSDDQVAIVRARIWLAIRKVDRDNTAWLKEVVGRDGWVDADKYGAEATDAAWLLVQHADQDPLFQFRILRELDPVVSPGKPKISKSRYALLRDRVMLKITGTQIYGSQLICKAGKWETFPIEHEASVDLRRAQMGLGPLKKYIEDFVRNVGKCNS